MEKKKKKKMEKKEQLHAVIYYCFDGRIRVSSILELMKLTDLTLLEACPQFLLNSLLDTGYPHSIEHAR